ncbi:thiamine phosphate synthase [Capnocytophaga sp. ARDL2]|uniref:thiamine phosphate synthase n=1 Tax=Capnocytophaga sp. ARDL2 TaxID=3238809 RepID=UPI0035579B6E
MLIIISPENTIPCEPQIINQLFDDGLELLHVRKYQFSDDEMRFYLGEIKANYYSKIVLHSHFHLAEKFGIHRLHIREIDRKNENFPQAKHWHLSTSVHSIDDFNQLEEHWQYAFLSPVFLSISKKGYGEHSDVLAQIFMRTNFHTKLLALGGITAENIEKVLQHGADGAALLGSIWLSKDPFEEFFRLKCILKSI